MENQVRLESLKQDVINELNDAILGADVGLSSEVAAAVSMLTNLLSVILNNEARLLAIEKGVKNG